MKIGYFQLLLLVHKVVGYNELAIVRVEWKVQNKVR